MICENCEGKGFVPSKEKPIWSPAPWDGSERREDERLDEKVKEFGEVPAPLYVSCEACDGSGRIFIGLIGTH